MRGGEAMVYSGPDRRVHKVFLTRNTEYHMRQETCVAVRDRDSGRWLDSHFALNRPAQGAIRFFDNGGLAATATLPRVGESMYFEDMGRDLVTSAVVAVERPDRKVVAGYSN